MALSDTRRVSRIGLGACMVATPVFLAAANFFDRNISSDNDAKYIAQVAAHHKAHWVSGLCWMLAAITLVGAMLGIAHLVRTRKPALANVAGPLAAAGSMAMLGWGVLSMGVDTALARNPHRAAMVSLYHDASNSNDVAPNVLLMFILLLAIIALAVGLWQTRTVPRALAAILGLAMVAVFMSDSGAGQVVASALLLVGLGGIGLTVLGRSDEEWETGVMPSGGSAAAEAPAAASA
jgi:hypothetical protein